MTFDRRNAVILLGLTVTLAALWYVLRDMNPDAVLSRLSQLNLFWVLALNLLYGLHFYLKARRWRLMLSPACVVSLQQAWPPMMAGYFANNLLPAHLGEFVRMYTGARSFGIPAARVLSSLVLERLLDLGSILLLLGLLLVSGGEMASSLKTFGILILLLVLAGLAFMVFYARNPAAVIRILRPLLIVLPERLRSGLLNQLDLGSAGASVLLHPELIWKILCLSILHWVLVAGMIDLAFLALGAPGDMQTALMILVATVFAVTLPSSPGFFGTIQVAFVVAAVPYGVDRDLALSASIVFHLSTWIFVNLLGILAINRLGLSWRELRNQASDE